MAHRQGVCIKELRRILQISKYYPPEVGGIEKIAYEINNAVCEKYETKVLCFTRTRFNATEYIKGGEVIRCGTTMKVFSQPISFSILKKLQQVLIDYSPDIVVIHEPNPLMTIGLISLLSNGVKLVVYWHSDIIKQRVGERILRGLYKRELKRANAIIATSQAYLEGSKYLISYRDKCEIVPNCVNEENLIVSPSVQKMAEKIRTENANRIICVGVGRLVKYKGFEYLAEVARILGTNYSFYVIGNSDSAEKSIKKHARGLSNFTLLGNVAEEVKQAYLLAADIFTFPSITKNEAFGIALVEGMYYKNPAVTFEIKGSGVNYVNVDGETGFTVDNKNIEQFASAIKKLGNDSELRRRMGENAHDRVIANFEYEQYKANIVRIMDQL